MKGLFLQKALKLCIVPAGIGTLITTICLTNISKPLYKLDSLTLQQLPDLEEEELKPVYVAPGGTGDGTSQQGSGGSDEQDNKGEQTTSGSKELEGGDSEKEEEGKKEEEEKKGENQDEEGESESSPKPKGEEEGVKNEILAGGTDSLEDILKEAIQKIGDLDISSIPYKLENLNTLVYQLQRVVAATEEITNSSKTTGEKSSSPEASKQ